MNASTIDSPTKAHPAKTYRPIHWADVRAHLINLLREEHGRVAIGRIVRGPEAYTTLLSTSNRAWMLHIPLAEIDALGEGLSDAGWDGAFLNIVDRALMAAKFAASVKRQAMEAA